MQQVRAALTADNAESSSAAQQTSQTVQRRPTAKVGAQKAHTQTKAQHGLQGQQSAAERWFMLSTLFPLLCLLLRMSDKANHGSRCNVFAFGQVI